MVLTKTPDHKIIRLQQELGSVYSIIDRIGIGGMGEVYLATHKTLGGKWAIKVLAEELARDPLIVERFVREAQIEANLQHPNIVKVFDISTRGDFQFLVMPYVEGENLDERIKRLSVLSPVEAVTISLHVVKALECAHGHGIVHRDLKPANIRIDHYGTVVVMDFGIARVLDSQQGKTMMGTRIGTPQYMSPEQSAGGTVDHRSDFYSLGVIIYEMIAGENPFISDNPFATGVRHLTVVPPSLATRLADLKPGLSQVVDKLLAKDPAQRYQTASDLYEALSPFGGGIEIRTPIPVAKPDSQSDLSAEAVIRLGPLEAILHRIPDPENPRDPTQDEQLVLKLADGVRSIRDILVQIPIAAESAAAALESLQNDGFVYTEIPAFGEPEATPRTAVQPGRHAVPPTQVPSQISLSARAQSSQSGAQIRTPSQPRIQPSRPGTQASVPNVRPESGIPDSGGMNLQPAKSPQKKYILMAIALVIVLGIAGVLLWPTFFKSKPPVITPLAVKQLVIQIDASPFARATIKSEQNQILFTEDTPFQKELPAGTYTVEFVNGTQSRTEKVTLDSNSSGVVRVDFWDTGQTKKLLESLNK
jgi:serine/threonine protein kinase